MLSKYIYLNAINKLSHERTINSVYHLFQGKKSVQTIQDCHLFQMKDYYAIDKTLTKVKFKKIILEFLNENLIQQKTNQNFTLTQSGLTWLSQHQSLAFKIYLNGWLYHNYADELFKKIQLMTQIWTNAYKNHMKFIPVIDDYAIRMWSKELFKMTHQKLDLYLTSLHDELSFLLQKMDKTAAMIFVQQLSSYRYTGSTLTQLSAEHDTHEVEVMLQTQNIIHYILTQAMQNKQTFPVLTLLINHSQLSEKAQLNQSTYETKRLFDKGLTLEEIKIKRNLKESTIKDHLIEMAYTESSFPFHQFYSKEQYENVYTIIKKLNTFQLKKIKSFVDESLSYFQIRLIIAAIHHKK